MHTYKVQTKDQLLISVTQWNDTKKPKGSLLIIHGLGEHQGRYAHVAKFYSENGYQVFSYDQRGHGLSEGKRGHSPGLGYNLDDLQRVLKTLSHNHLYIYAHSFGGNVLANYLLREQPNFIRAVVLSAPWLRLAREPKHYELLLAKLMNSIYPSFTQSNQVEVQYLSNVDEVGQDYLEDPLNHNMISARLFIDFHKAGLWAIKNAKKLPCKTLLIQGENDPITCSSGAINFYENSNGNAEIKLYKNTMHEPHNDLCSQKVLSDSLQWMEKCLD